MSEVLPKPLISEDKIRHRVEELAAEISADYAGLEDVLLIGVLRGCYIFLADLSRLLAVPRRIDFIAVQSYGDSTTSGAVRLLMDVRSDIEGQQILIVEDIVDTGRTLRYLLESFAARRAASIKSCVLVCKRRQRDPEVRIDYLGFEIPDLWVVGYGLDYADRHRALPYIGALEVGD